MKIIYHCYGGSHSSVSAAAIHLGMLSENRLPTKEELMSLPYFDKTDGSDFGLIRMMGTDYQGNEVYVLGKKGMGEKFNRTLEGMARIIGVDSELIVINTMPCVNWIMMAGGYLSRRMGMLCIGRPLVIYGTKKAFPCLVKTVRECRSRIQNRPASISFPRNNDSVNIAILGVTPFHHTQAAAATLLRKYSKCESSPTRLDVGIIHDGTPVFMGRDNEGNRVYTIGLGREMETGAKALACLVSLFASRCQPVLITSVRIRGEIWVRMASALAGWPGGRWLQRLVFHWIIKPQRKIIEQQAGTIRKALDVAKSWHVAHHRAVSRHVT